MSLALLGCPCWGCGRKFGESSDIVGQISTALVKQRELSVPWSFHEASKQQGAYAQTFFARRFNLMFQGCLHLCALSLATAVATCMTNWHPGCCYHACASISFAQCFCGLCLNIVGLLVGLCPFVDESCCCLVAAVARGTFNLRQYLCMNFMNCCGASIEKGQLYHFKYTGNSVNFQDCAALVNELLSCETAVRWVLSKLVDCLLWCNETTGV